MKTSLSRDIRDFRAWLLKNPAIYTTSWLSNGTSLNFWSPTVWAWAREERALDTNPVLKIFITILCEAIGLMFFMAIVDASKTTVGAGFSVMLLTYLYALVRTWASAPLLAINLFPPRLVIAILLAAIFLY